jgi:hypothetical protein
MNLLYLKYRFNYGMISLVRQKNFKMRANIKSIFIVLILLTTLALGWWLGRKSNQSNRVGKESSTLIMEKIKKVSKLVTVEGYISEIYAYEEYQKYDWPILRKKALIRVSGRVSVGYDFNRASLEIDEDAKVVYFKSIPEAELLSIEHDLDYYDIQEGMFNKFTTEDYNRMNRHAKDVIRKSAIKSGLMEAAEEQKTEFFETISLILQGFGYELIVDERGISPGLEL